MAKIKTVSLDSLSVQKQGSDNLDSGNLGLNIEWQTDATSCEVVWLLQGMIAKNKLSLHGNVLSQLKFSPKRDISVYGWSNRDIKVLCSNPEIEPEQAFDALTALLQEEKIKQNDREVTLVYQMSNLFDWASVYSSFLRKIIAEQKYDITLSASLGINPGGDGITSKVVFTDNKTNTVLLEQMLSKKAIEGKVRIEYTRDGKNVEHEFGDDPNLHTMIAGAAMNSLLEEISAQNIQTNFKI